VPDGAEQVTGYRLVVRPSGRVINLGRAATSATVGGLTNGTPYRFAVSAVNELGVGSSTISNVVVPAGVPTQVRSVRATPRIQSVQLTWRRPKTVNGAELRFYRVAVTGAARRTMKVPAGTTRLLVKRLRTGAHYRFAVEAVNSVGAGPKVRTSRVRPK
jgi:hypothetical protein